MGQSYSIYACTCANHAYYYSSHSSHYSSHSILQEFETHFIKVISGRKGRNGTGRQVESVKHMEQHHIKFGDKSHNLK
mgnify:CR=1 FL=1